MNKVPTRRYGIRRWNECENLTLDLRGIGLKRAFNGRVIVDARFFEKT